MDSPPKDNMTTPSLCWFPEQGNHQCLHLEFTFFVSTRSAPSATLLQDLDIHVIWLLWYVIALDLWLSFLSYRHPRSQRQLSATLSLLKFVHFELSCLKEHQQTENLIKIVNCFIILIQQISIDNQLRNHCSTWGWNDLTTQLNFDNIPPPSNYKSYCSGTQ